MKSRKENWGCMKLPICAVFCVAAAISDRSMWDEWHKNDLFIIDSMKYNSWGMTTSNLGQIIIIIIILITHTWAMLISNRKAVRQSYNILMLAQTFCDEKSTTWHTLSKMSIYILYIYQLLFLPLSLILFL